MNQSLFDMSTDRVPLVELGRGSYLFNLFGNDWTLTFKKPVNKFTDKRWFVNLALLKEMDFNVEKESHRESIIAILRLPSHKTKVGLIDNINKIVKIYNSTVPGKSNQEEQERLHGLASRGAKLVKFLSTSKPITHKNPILDQMGIDTKPNYQGKGIKELLETPSLIISDNIKNSLPSHAFNRIVLAPGKYLMDLFGFQIRIIGERVGENVHGSLIWYVNFYDNKVEARKLSPFHLYVLSRLGVMCYITKKDLIIEINSFIDEINAKIASANFKKGTLKPEQIRGFDEATLKALRKIALEVEIIKLKALRTAREVTVAKDDLLMFEIDVQIEQLQMELDK